LNSLTIESLTIESLTIESLTIESLTIESLTIESLTIYSEIENYSVEAPFRMSFIIERYSEHHSASFR